MKKIILVLFICLVTNNSYAELPYILNFKYILNEVNGKKKLKLLKS